MVGTGFPDALHSNVTVLPFRAATCPFCGTALSVGGTKEKYTPLDVHLNNNDTKKKSPKISTVCTWSLVS